MRANNNQIGMIFILIGMLIYSFHDLAVKIIANETTIFQLFITRAFVGVIVTMTCLKCLNYQIKVKNGELRSTDLRDHSAKKERCPIANNSPIIIN